MWSERFNNRSIEKNEALDFIDLPVVTTARHIREAAIQNGLEPNSPWNNDKQIIIALLSVFAAIPTAEPIRRIWAGIDYQVSEADKKRYDPHFRMGEKTLNVVVDFKEEKGDISRLEPFFNSELLTSRIGNGSRPHMAELMDYLEGGSAKEQHEAFIQRTKGLYFVVYGEPLEGTAAIQSPQTSRQITGG